MGRLAVVIPAVCVLLIASGCKSTEWEEKYLEKEQENRALQEAFDAQNTRLAEKDASADVLRGELSETEAQVKALAEEIERREQQPVAPAPEPGPDPEIEALRADYERLQKKYGELVRITEDGNLEITLPASVTFASGSYNLTSQGKRTLESVARELRNEFSSNRIRIIGHTDTDPIKKSPFKDNYELGAERALAVMRYLAKNGVENQRMESASRGPSAPIADNSTEAGKKKNRRVEITVIMPRRGR